MVVEEPHVTLSRANRLYLAIGLLLVASLLYALVSMTRKGSAGNPASPKGPAPQVAVDIDSQIEVAKQLAASHPTGVNYVNLSQAFMRGQRWVEGINACRNAVSIDPKNVIAYNNMGFAQIMLKNYADAEVSLNKALELAPNFELAKNNLNMLMAERDKALKIINDLNASIKTKPSAASYLSLSHQYYTLGMHKESIQADLRALELEPNNADVLNNLCASYNVLGQWDDAIRACQKAIQLKPDFQLAKNNLAFSQSSMSSRASTAQKKTPSSEASVTGPSMSGPTGR